MFSLLPALPWAVRVAEVNLDAGVDRELAVLSHLGALVPGDRAAEPLGELLDLGGHRSADGGGGVVAAGQVQQQRHRE